ncbi:MAG TPA: aminomethyltransferase family protein [Actinomycetota bacterium]|nr:aminomethyltransferase family protein [Actinomycetota bacterium]
MGELDMAEEEAIRTAFHEVTAAQGGTHVADGGWLWLEGFGDVRKEYEAARDDVAVWDVSPLNKWEFRGADARRAAQHVFSNDATNLEVGQVRYGAFLDPDGLMVDDGTVYHTGRPDHCWVMTNGKNHQGYFGEMLEGFDVEVEWIAPRMPHLGVIGPRSREVVQSLTDADLSREALRYFRFIPDAVQVGGVPVFLSRTAYGGELGFELFLTDPADAAALWNAVVGAGVTPFGVEAIEILRIEAGLIVTDYDYEAHQRSPYDFNLDRLVALDAPVGFVGKQRLAEVATAPPNRFVTLRYEAETLPEYGAVVTKQGEEVGVLTSPTDSPRFGKIGMAVVRTEMSAMGTELEVAVGEGTVPATVDALPLYDTQKTRPRS